MKTKILVVFALGMGIFNAGAWVFMFWQFRNGDSAYEPNVAIATMEMDFAIFLTFLTLTAFIFYLRGVR